MKKTKRGRMERARERIHCKCCRSSLTATTAGAGPLHSYFYYFHRCRPKNEPTNDSGIPCRQREARSGKKHTISRAAQETNKQTSFKDNVPFWHGVCRFDFSGLSTHYFFSFHTFSSFRWHSGIRSRACVPSSPPHSLVNSSLKNGK